MAQRQIFASKKTFKSMLDKNTRDRIKDLIGREVVPAIGCTEPVAVALAVAKATETLGGDAAPARIEVTLSGNILKNAMGVGIPGTGMIGLPIAIALGALVGKSEYGLEVLRDVNDDAVERGKSMIAEGRVSVGHDPKAPDKLYIAAVVCDESGTHSGKAVICGGHTHFVDIVKDGEVLLHEDVAVECCVEDDEMCLTLETVWKYAIESPIEELAFIKEAERLNRAAAERALNGSGFGHKVGRIIATAGKSMYGDTPARHMLAMTAGACDARMAGEPVAVMSNSGSGNQGITITLPVVTYAEEINASEEQRVRALVLAHLTSIYIKQSLGRLSALCGCVVAATGASIALTYLMGGDFTHGTYAVKNMVATLTGMICDGAKPACALKIMSGVNTALVSALMAMNDECVTADEGIVDDDVDVTVRNLTAIGREAMNETDLMVLKIMSDH